MKDRPISAPTRRDFLRWAAGGAASTTAFSALSSGPLFAAAAQGGGGYKALVVLYLAGGNDSFNLIVPTDSSAYNEYATSRQNLAVPLNDLLDIAPATSDGHTYGLHPAVPELRDLFDAGRLAISVNTGNLVRPVTRAEYQASSVALPPRLFSHNDQQAQSMRVRADDGGAIGWGGALADHQAYLNGVTSLSPSITVAGSTPMLTGAATQAYHLGTSGSVSLGGFNGNTGAAIQATFDALRGQGHTNLYQRQFAQTRAEAIELDGVISAALGAQTTLQTEFPAESKVSPQLKMVAKMIQAQATLGMERQVFFVRMGGFDTHAGQLEDQPVLYADISASVAAFQAAMAELLMENQVTLAVVSEFGRTLSSNGQGTDHGWGGHFLAVGGAVAGGDLYGTMPSFALEGADDAGSGRMIPSQGTDQFAATLARWFGVPDIELAVMFPNLGNFATNHLGFMG
ncbi:hypothetical protein Poly30_34570 [Planctomycetes bacterium Poly30]|uniref:DUF1501 domain-containing protein n=1 Tax=Saltatorellus ferox TaxID=2528018 RepID=A0A518EUZ9_9BACT|nr:hypothetical protein Poly30_34570 [Planctomycetes bacterium Poly30]